MKLKNGILRPGIVREVLPNGIIKAVAPGLFSITDDTSLLPPIQPWFIGNNINSYSQPKTNDEVWILNFADNPLQLYWFRKEYTDSNWENIPMSYRNVEVLCNRETDNGWATIYFTDGTGWVIGNGNTKLILAADGSIIMSTGNSNRYFHINDKSISLGSLYQSEHPAAYGDVIEDILTSLSVLLNGIATKALMNPHTAAIGTEILKTLPDITKQISDISSEHVTID